MDDIMKKLEGDPGTEAPKDEPQEAPSDMDALLAELEKIGVEKPEQLQNMATASAQAGKAWNMVGELKEQNRRLQALLEQQQPKPDDYSQPVDIEKVVMSAVRKFYQEDVIRPQQEAAERYYRDMEEIQADPDYEVVKDVWDKHRNSPSVVTRVQSGQSSMKTEFDKTVRTYYRELAKRSFDVFKGMKPTARPPHIEGSESRSVQMPTEKDEKEQKIQKYHEQRQKGALSSDAALEGIVKAALSSDDPIWRT